MSLNIHLHENPNVNVRMPNGMYIEIPKELYRSIETVMTDLNRERLKTYIENVNLDIEELAWRVGELDALADSHASKELPSIKGNQKALKAYNEGREYKTKQIIEAAYKR